MDQGGKRRPHPESQADVLHVHDEHDASHEEADEDTLEDHGLGIEQPVLGIEQIEEQ